MSQGSSALHQESSLTYWHGPVVFRKHIPYGAYSSNHKLFFDNKVSGPDGITVMGKDEINGSGTRIRFNPTLELSYPGNTFEGGVAVNFGMQRCGSHNDAYAAFKTSVTAGRIAGPLAAFAHVCLEV